MASVNCRMELSGAKSRRDDPLLTVGFNLRQRMKRTSSKSRRDDTLFDLQQGGMPPCYYGRKTSSRTAANRITNATPPYPYSIILEKGIRDTKTKTSFIPNSSNKTTSVVAQENANTNQPHYLINTGKNEVMRSMFRDNAYSTEVVTLLKLAGNEVGNAELGNKGACPLAESAESHSNVFFKYFYMSVFLIIFLF